MCYVFQVQRASQLAQNVRKTRISMINAGLRLAFVRKNLAFVRKNLLLVKSPRSRPVYVHIKNPKCRYYVCLNELKSNLI